MARLSQIAFILAIISCTTVNPLFAETFNDQARFYQEMQRNKILQQMVNTPDRAETERLQEALRACEAKQKIVFCQDGHWTRLRNGCKKHGGIKPFNICADGTYNHNNDVDACEAHGGFKD